jgi:ABC-type transporter Mla subunit MlaD
MPKRISHFQLGLFFLAALTIILGGLLWVGATHFFQPAKTYVTFFNESVEGLSPGAGVSYLGVQVGRVTAVGIAPDGKLIRVELKLRQDFNMKSMAVQLKLKGITGQLYLAVGQAPPDIGQVTPKISFHPKYPVIPSQPGGIYQIEEALDKIYKKINSADLKGLTESWTKTARDADALVSNQDIRRTIRNLREISGDIKNLVGILGEPGTPKKWRESFHNLAETAAAARQASEALAAQLEKLPPQTIADLSRKMEQTLLQVDQVLTSLKGLVHELREQPGKVLVIPHGKEPFRR